MRDYILFILVFGVINLHSCQKNATSNNLENIGKKDTKKNKKMIIDEYAIKEYYKKLLVSNSSENSEFEE